MRSTDSKHVQTSLHWGAYQVEVQDERIGRRTAVRRRPGSVAHRDGRFRTSCTTPPAVWRSRWCARVGWSGDRSTTVEAAGRSRSFPVGWDEALDLVAGELRRVRDASGNAAIFGGFLRLGLRGPFPPCPEPTAPVPEPVRRLRPGRSIPTAMQRGRSSSPMSSATTGHTSATKPRRGQ